MESAGTIGRSPLIIDDTPGITVAELGPNAAGISRPTGGPDHHRLFQLMSGGKKFESRQQEISEILPFPKGAGQGDGCTGHRPFAAEPYGGAEETAEACPFRLEGIRFHQRYADVVMFIYRDDYYNEDSEKKGLAEIIRGKTEKWFHRKCGTVWLGQYTKFGNKERVRM